MTAAIASVITGSLILVVAGSGCWRTGESDRTASSRCVLRFGPRGVGFSDGALVRKRIGIVGVGIWDQAQFCSNRRIRKRS